MSYPTQHTVTRRAPAASNYGSKVGYIVYESNADEVTLDDGTHRPFGVITAAEDATGGLVAVCVLGECDLVLDAATTFTMGGGTGWIRSDANGKGVESVAADGKYAVGRLLSRADVAAATNRTKILVQPTSAVF